MFSTPDKKKQKINFRFQKAISISNRETIKKTIVTLFKKEKQTLDCLDIIFCSDEYLLDINKVNLNHNYYTDTITFNYTPKNQKGVLGEIYISVDRIRDNAIRFNSTIKQELLRVIFHSSLHLCGYQDKTFAQKEQMTTKEDFFIGVFNKHVSRGT